MCRCVQTFRWYTCNICHVILNKCLSLLFFEQSCANTTNKENCCNCIVVQFYTWFDFSLNILSETVCLWLTVKSLQTLKIHIFNRSLSPDWLCPVAHGCCFFLLSLSGIHFVLVVVSPCRVQRIQLTTLLQLALNTSPRYCLALSLSRSLCSFLSSLSLTYFLFC